MCVAGVGREQQEKTEKRQQPGQWGGFGGEELDFGLSAMGKPHLKLEVTDSVFKRLPPYHGYY